MAAAPVDLLRGTACSWSFALISEGSMSCSHGICWLLRGIGDITVMYFNTGIYNQSTPILWYGFVPLVFSLRAATLPALCRAPQRHSLLVHATVEGTASNQAAGLSMDQHNILANLRYPAAKCFFWLVMDGLYVT